MFTITNPTQGREQTPNIHGNNNTVSPRHYIVAYPGRGIFILSDLFQYFLEISQILSM